MLDVLENQWLFPESKIFRSKEKVKKIIATTPDPIEITIDK